VLSYIKQQLLLHQIKQKIKGVEVLTGNKMEPIDNIIFSIPNLMGISGGVVKISPTRITTTLSRILLDNEKMENHY
jgi:hypothetical protein